MANTDAPFGLRPYTQGLAAGASAQINAYYYPSGGTLLFVGDAVVLTGTANTSSQGLRGEWAIGTLPAIARATGGAGAATISGVVVGFHVDPANAGLDITYNPATTDRVVLVSDDPHMLYEIQADATADIAVTDIGSTADLIFTQAGDQTTGLSGAELDTSVMNTSATGQLTIMRMANRENNALGTNTRLVVQINTHSGDNNIAGI